MLHRLANCFFPRLRQGVTRRILPVMKTRPFIAALFLLAALPGGQALAQTPYEPPLADDPAPGQDSGPDGFERGIESILDNLMNDLAPQIEGLSGALSEYAPVLEDLSVLVDDLGNYQMPERLENGDIIIRRRPGAPPPPPIGEDLRDFTDPAPGPAIPIDPDRPEIAL